MRIDSPYASHCVVDAPAFISEALPYRYEYEWLAGHELFSRILGDDLLDVSDPIIPRAMSADYVGQTRIGINQGCFDLESDLLRLDLVPMNNMSDIETGAQNLFYTLAFQVCRILVRCSR